jgi:omega-3 fatty acid desaturase (delta-15 desaturase)
VAYVVISYLSSLTASLWIQAMLVVLYWAVQGTFFMALFVLGHDCGHGSFSDHHLLNDVVGTITHGFLMVPYYQWKLSHRNHHKHTGNIDKDEVFYPVRQSEQSGGRKLLPGFAFGFGWYGCLTRIICAENVFKIFILIIPCPVFLPGL